MGDTYYIHGLVSGRTFREKLNCVIPLALLVDHLEWGLLEKMETFLDYEKYAFTEKQQPWVI